MCVCFRTFLPQLKSTLTFFCKSCGLLYVLFVSVHIIRFYSIWFDDYFSSIELMLLWLPLSPQAKLSNEISVHTHTLTHMHGSHTIYWVQRSTMQKNKWELDRAKCVHYLFASCTVYTRLNVNEWKEIPLWALNKYGEVFSFFLSSISRFRFLLHFYILSFAIE